MKRAGLGVDPGAAILAMAACLGLVHGAELFQLPHLILGLTVLSFAQHLPESPGAYRLLRATALLLVVATLVDAVLLATGIYDRTPSGQPFRPRWLGHFALWLIFLFFQRVPQEGEES